VYICTRNNNKQKDKMKTASNNIEINNCKLVMDNLMICVNDKSIAIQERNQYYSEYLKLASNYYLLLKNAK
jgi:hypothetical protein